MTPDEAFYPERRKTPPPTWTERHWKKVSAIAGLLVVFSTCTGATLSWFGINIGEIGPAAKFHSIEAKQDTIASEVVGLKRSMNILATMLCTAPTRTPRDERAQRQCDRFLLDLEEEEQR